MDELPGRRHKYRWPPNVRLKQAREERGWDRPELARQIVEYLNTVEDDFQTGCDNGYVQRWEDGVRRPTSRYQRALMGVLERSASELGFLPSSALAPEETSQLSGEAVRRLELESRLRELVGASQYPVVLWGESGNGKSFLANEFASELERSTGMPAALIRVAENQSNKDSVHEMDLFRTLELLGVEPSRLNRGAQLATLRRALASDDCLLAVLILDDASPQTMEEYIPKSPAVPILVTTRAAIPNTPAVFVPAYEPDEALRYSSNVCPEASREKLESLSRLLGRRPLAMDVALRATTEGYVTLDELLSCLVESRVETVSASETLVGDPNRQPLSALYYEIARRMESDPTAMGVLDLCLWLTSGLMRIEQMNQFMIGGSEPSSIEKLRVSAGMAKLTRLGLIVQRTQALEMNELTREMLREHLGHRVSGALDRFETTILNAPLDSLDDQSRLTAFEFTYAKEALTMFIGRGESGMVCLSPWLWLFYERDGPWRDQVLFGDGLTLLEVVPTISGGRYRRENDWTYIADAQRLFLYNLIKLYVRRNQYTYSRLPQLADMKDKPPLGLVPRNPIDGEYRHQWLEPIDEHFAADELPAWALCGLRDVPTSDDELPACPDCAALSSDRDNWRSIYDDAEGYALIASHVAVPTDRLWIRRLYTIRHEARRQGGGYHSRPRNPLDEQPSDGMDTRRDD